MFNRKLNILVLGNNGMLGHEVYVRLVSLSQDKHSKIGIVIGLDVEAGIDLTKRHALGNYFMNSIHYDWCINCTAYTNTAAAQNSKDGYNLSYKLNALAPKYIAESCYYWNTKLIHVSTDYVFSDRNNENHQMFDVDDECFPCNVYGEHKLLGELFIEEIFGKKSDRYAILRTSWLYGTHNNKSFIHKFMKNIARCLKENKDIEMTSNEVSVPTSTYFLYNQILSVICENKHGIIHAVPHSEKGVSRLEFANEILLLLESFDNKNLLKDVELKPIERDSYWPKFSVMKSLSLVDWRYDLAQYLSLDNYNIAKQILEYSFAK